MKPARTKRTKRRGFEWRQDEHDKCCWFLEYKGEHLGCVCENGISAYDGRAVYSGGSLEQRKKYFEEYVHMEKRVEKYREKLVNQTLKNRGGGK